MSEAVARAEMAEAGEREGRMRGRSVGHRIEIDAPPELVWDFIADFEGWQGWNPLYVETRGRAEPGATLHFQVRLPGMKPQRARARVLACEPEQRLEYLVSGLGGLVRTQRVVALEELSPTRCAVLNLEIMGGLLGGVLSRMLGEKVGQALEGMNAALRTIAERKWRGQSG
ncbi:SRPBCC family protein [Novosphingobium soli]|uniref:SRPBCC family protein n=1 Tax=Novosphingobium soli TaxID=574956 RepID=A0ABV6CUU3_9SPHN